MWYPILAAVVLAVGFDLCVFWANPPRRDAHNNYLPKNYYPNLRVWGFGLLTGVVIFAAQMFRHATDRLNNDELLPGVLWPRLAPSVYILVILWLLVWGIVRLSRSE